MPAVIAGGVGASLPNLTGIGKDPSGFLTINGEGAQTTTATVDGAPIFPTGSPMQLGLLSPDIFGSASVSQDGTAGAPDGTLALQTFDPTIDWQGVVRNRPSSYGGDSLSLQERGTSGRVGLSGSYSSSSDGDPIDGAYFADASGLYYQHHTNAKSQGLSFTGRYGLSSNNVVFLDAGALATNDPYTCDVLFGTLPCGYGPGNGTNQGVNFLQLRNTFELERLSLETHVFASQDTIGSDFSNILVGGLSFGTESSIAIHRVGAIAKLGLLLPDNRVVQLDYTQTRDSAVLGGDYLQSGVALPPSVTNAAQFAVKYPLITRRRINVTPQAGIDSASGAAAGTYGVHASYQLDARNALDVQVQTGGIGSAPYQIPLAAPPYTLQFDCGHTRAVGAGPLAASSGVSTTQMRVGWKYATRHFSASVNAYRNLLKDPSIDATVRAASLPLGTFPNGYFTQASTLASTVCGSPQVLDSANVFTSVGGTAMLETNDGVNASTTFNLGEKAVVDLSYSLNRLRAFGSGALFGSDSTVTAGVQMPGIPIHRMAADLRYALDAKTSLLGVWQFTGANNLASTAAFSTFDAAIRKRLAVGDMILAVQNATNANAGTFLPLQRFPFVSQPLAPRTWSLAYRLPLGDYNVDKTQYLSAALPIGSTFFFIPVPFTRETSHWLAPATDRPFCGPESIQAAAQYLHFISEYREAIVAARTHAPNMQSFPGRSMKGMSLGYLATAQGGYEIRITLDPSQRLAVQPFMECAMLHFGTYDQATRLQLYTPGWKSRARSSWRVLYYAPQAGLYLAPDAIDETRAAVSSSPNHEEAHGKFSLNEQSCPETYRSAITIELAQLKSYIEGYYRGENPLEPTDFHIVAHKAKGGAWLEILSGDRHFGSALARCVGASDLSARQLSKLDLAGAFPPSLNYAPKLGFYEAHP